MGSDRSYDISAARSDLGYAPLVSFEDGVQELRSHRKRAVS
jgi:nucleoside-diphosphate-sugar epimerase